MVSVVKHPGVASKVTNAVIKFISAEADFKKTILDAIDKDMAKGTSKTEIAEKLKMTFFAATVPMTMAPKLVQMNIAPIILKLFVHQIDKVDWDLVLESILSHPELN